MSTAKVRRVRKRPMLIQDPLYALKAVRALVTPGKTWLVQRASLLTYFVFVDLIGHDSPDSSLR